MNVLLAIALSAMLGAVSLTAVGLLISEREFAEALREMEREMER